MSKIYREIKRLERKIKRELAQDPTGEKLKQLRKELDELLEKLSAEEQSLPKE